VPHAGHVRHVHAGAGQEKRPGEDDDQAEGGPHHAALAPGDPLDDLVQHP
jgi:hypothetical protein